MKRWMLAKRHNEKVAELQKALAKSEDDVRQWKHNYNQILACLERVSLWEATIRLMEKEEMIEFGCRINVSSLHSYMPVEDIALLMARRFEREIRCHPRLAKLVRYEGMEPR